MLYLYFYIPSIRTVSLLIDLEEILVHQSPFAFRLYDFVEIVSYV